MLHHGEWPSPELGSSVDARVQLLAPCCQRRGIPTAVIAMDHEVLCGFALLIKQDFDPRPDLTPWLAGVFVRTQYRNRGVASALVTRIESEAKLLAMPTIYLYTAHSELLYARLGWLVVERRMHNNRHYVVMSKSL
jgi:GNAT superfamily N-acetyltransferase